MRGMNLDINLNKEKFNNWNGGLSKWNGSIEFKEPAK